MDDEGHVDAVRARFLDLLHQARSINEHTRTELRALRGTVTQLLEMLREICRRLSGDGMEAGWRSPYQMTPVPTPSSTTSMSFDNRDHGSTS